MTKLRILPYKPGSESARALVNALNPKAIMKKQRTPIVGRNKIMLNWGNSQPQFSLNGVKVLNKPEAVRLASNKLSAFQVMKQAGVTVPEFTSDINVAREWIEDQRIVFCRTLLRANSGCGIVIAKELSELVNAPLYVKYIRKEKEYRLHVFNGQVIDLVEKRRRRGFQESNMYNRYVRSYQQGWIMARDGVYVNQDVKDMAIKAVKALGLDFGAVDLVLDRNNQPVILEVNTAAGLQGTTVLKYKEAVLSWLRALENPRSYSYEEV